MTMCVAVGAAVREVGGLFVLDCIASGTVWIDMADCRVDVLISARRKGWSGPPCCGLVGLGERAYAGSEESKSSSFACDLLKWLQIMESYGERRIRPTIDDADGCAVAAARDAMLATERFGFRRLPRAGEALGKARRIRDMWLKPARIPERCRCGFDAPGVVVSYTTRS